MLQIKSFDEQIGSIALTMTNNRLMIDFLSGATSLRRSKT
jgi:hypothetical protein